jgi:tRNA uridine 5-carbamoylmethylation protein Kti12
MDLHKLKNIKSPYVLVLVGPPLSGKTSFYKKFIKEVDSDVLLISRDEILMEVYGSRNYTEAFKMVDQSKVDYLLDERIKEANISNRNVIIDMTNMTSKRRKKNIRYFSENYYKVAVIFPILSEEEYIRRNSKRIKEENKDLPMHVIKSMISSYQNISTDEGFNKIISL